MTEGVRSPGASGAQAGGGGSGSVKAAAVVGVFLALSVWTYAIDARYLYFSAYLWFGFIYGMCLQYGRFCMASAVRDLFAVGVPRMAVGIMIAVVLFALVSAAVTVSGKNTFHASPIGLFSLVGGAIFGFGMVFTGGCASGSLYKTGEGSMSALVVVFALSFAQAVFVDVGGVLNALVPDSWTAAAAAKNLPAEVSATNGWYDQFLAGYIWDLSTFKPGELLGFKSVAATAFIGNALLVAIIPAIATLVVIYIFYYRKGYLRREKDAAPGLGREVAGWWSMVTASKRTAIAGLVLGVAAGLQMWVMQSLKESYGIDNLGELLTALGHTTGLSLQETAFDPGYFYVTTQEAQGAGWALAQVGWNITDNIFFGLDNGIPNPLVNPVLWMSVSVIGGAMAMALLNNEFKFKLPTMETALWAIIGGTLMGIGARIGMGCNIGAFFATVTNGDPSGWIFGLGMVVGGYIGVKVFNWWIERKMAKEADLDFA